MNCHLITSAQEQKLTADRMRDETILVESIRETDSFFIKVLKCKECEQQFIQCFKQYTSPDWDDDYWTFWIPVDQNEVDRIKAAPNLLKHMGELVYKTSHICWHPDGNVFWAKDGFPMALIVFMP